MDGPGPLKQGGRRSRPTRSEPQASEVHRALLFVYGTLRRGGAAATLLEGARPLGPARFQGRLYDLGTYPGAVASPDPRESVRGELYAPAPGDAEALLARLDRYEGPEFRRVRAAVTDAQGHRRQAWIYLYTGDLDGRASIASGDYLAAAPIGGGG